ncbi:TadE/TadG family type IV pilus assembly protein [Rhizobium hainanense]|uniref:Flp pilus assembly protein TadG n=1 Tax=Rhizobium hainanense TaxID=52131 RepID=A0A1C3W154_9HYPH|nr:TadE/TadG family type IV pilus assembly protein [Rhizobium hainanense]SCB33656.1 Flp pilus assembly protein TadG [Rhizobium hainanense]
MMIKCTHLAYRSIVSCLRRLAGNRAGVSGVEFALVLPILLLLLAATVDLGHALTVSRKIDEIAATTGDVISQQGTWTKSNVTGLLSGMSFILQPYDTTALTITVAVEDVPANGNATVNWSAAFNTSALVSGAATPISVPAKIQETGVQVVLTRVQYSFTTPLSAFLGSFTGISSYSFNRYFFNRPRTADKITYS